MWMDDSQDQSSGRELKPIWEYKPGVEGVTVLPDKPRDLVLLTGDMDPTGTWTHPIGVWTHSFKAVGGGSGTVVCDKWNEACPLCYENEIYKLSRPDYKNTGGRLPYGISKKGLVQVYDIELDKVLWLFAGKQIQDGMSFILTRMAAQYKGVITLTRMGKGLDTSYRVDVSPAPPLTPEQLSSIKDMVVPMVNTMELFKLTRDEVQVKSGLNALTYFSAILAKGYAIDISNWGHIPTADGLPIHTAPPVQNTTPAPPVEYIPPPAAAAATINPTTAAAISQHLALPCSVGMFAGKTYRDVVQGAGKPYLQYIANQGNDEEKLIAQFLLESFEDVQKIMTNQAF